MIYFVIFHAADSGGYYESQQKTFTLLRKAEILRKYPDAVVQLGTKSIKARFTQYNELCICK